MLLRVIRAPETPQVAAVVLRARVGKGARRLTFLNGRGARACHLPDTAVAARIATLADDAWSCRGRQQRLGRIVCWKQPLPYPINHLAKGLRLNARSTRLIRICCLGRFKGCSNNFFKRAQQFRSDDLFCQNPLLNENGHKCHGERCLCLHMGGRYSATTSVSISRSSSFGILQAPMFSPTRTLRCSPSGESIGRLT